MWQEQRRPEIVELFDREIYGRVPSNVPAVTWEVTATNAETQGGVPVVTKQLVGHVDHSAYPSITVDIRLSLTTPTNSAGPVPVIMEFGFAGPPGGAATRAAAAPPPSTQPTWQQQVLERCWGYAVI